MKTSKILVNLMCIGSILAKVASLPAFAGGIGYETEYPLEILSSDYYDQEVDWNLWDKFLKYDLRITDYDSLTDYEKELCRFIFESERSANEPIRCERARRILAGEDVGERLMLEQLDGASGILDPAYHKLVCSNTLSFIADIEHLDHYSRVREYWLDDSGKRRIICGSQPSSFEYIEQLDETNKYNTELIACEETIVIGNIETEEAIYTILQDGTVIYSLNNGNSYNGEVVIPDLIDGRSVDSVTDFACSDVSGVKFPETLREISDDAFTECVNLSEITINCPAATIGKRSFEMSGLKTADITAKIIDENAFDNCTGLQTLKLNEGIESIEANAFLNCENLTGIIIPSSLKYIGQGAFSGTGINEITIPETVEIIGVYPDRVGATSGAIFYYPATDPLTDEPVCVFDPDCVINGWYNTEAHRYALEWGLKFNPMDEDVAYGDTNLDGEISMADMVLLQSYLKGNISEIGYEADLMEDGIIDAFDMIRMRSSVLAYR